MECFKIPSVVNKLYSTQTHGFVSLPLAIFGIILNILVISIFLQKSMRNPTNNILIGISLSDMFMMFIYAPNSVYFFILHPDPYPEQSTFWPYFRLAYHHISVFFHACSVWLTCYLALYRLINAAHCVLKKFSNKKVLEQNVNCIMVLIVLVVFLFMIPNMLIYNINSECIEFICNGNRTSRELAQKQCSPAIDYAELFPKNLSINFNESMELIIGGSAMEGKFVTYFTIKQLGTSDLGSSYPNLISLNLSIHSIIFRAVPSMMMMILSVMLIYVLSIANKNKQKLHDRQEDRQQNDFNRTTTMLLVIVILFLVMEFPNGLLLLIGSISQSYYFELSDYFGEFLDLLVLINSSINFFLYCIMSSEFRRTFKETYLSGDFRQDNPLLRRHQLSSRERINLDLRMSKKNKHKELPDAETEENFYSETKLRNINNEMLDESKHLVESKSS